jgi:hypothetical protein
MMTATETAAHLLPLYLVTRDRDGRAVWARDSIHAIEQTGWEAATVERISIVATQTPWGDALAIRTPDMDVFEPYASECGRFCVDPLVTYGIHPAVADVLTDLNARHGYATGDYY